MGRNNQIGLSYRAGPNKDDHNFFLTGSGIPAILIGVGILVLCLAGAWYVIALI